MLILAAVSTVITIATIIVARSYVWSYQFANRSLWNVISGDKEEIACLKQQLSDAAEAAETFASWYGVEHPECHQFNQLVDEARLAYVERYGIQPQVH